MLPMMTTPGAHGTSREPAVGARVNPPDGGACDTRTRPGPGTAR